MDCKRSERDINIPIGIPTEIQIKVQIEIIASVDIVSSHMPKYPIKRKEQTVPAITNQLLEPIQAIIAITSIINGQGALINNFSNQTRK